MAITEKRMSLALPNELMRKLDLAAKRNRLTRSGLIRLALTHYLEAESRVRQGKKRSCKAAK